MSKENLTMVKGVSGTGQSLHVEVVTLLSQGNKDKSLFVEQGDGSLSDRLTAAIESLALAA